MMATFCDGMRCDLIQLKVLVLESAATLRFMTQPRAWWEIVASLFIGSPHALAVYLNPW
jgi:hypothetical protein